MVEQETEKEYPFDFRIFQNKCIQMQLSSTIHPLLDSAGNLSNLSKASNASNASAEADKARP